MGIGLGAGMLLSLDKTREIARVDHLSGETNYTPGFPDISDMKQDNRSKYEIE